MPTFQLARDVFEAELASVVALSLHSKRSCKENCAKFYYANAGYVSVCLFPESF